MDQQKRLLLAFALSFAVLMLWRLLFPPPLPRKPATAPVKTASSAQPQQPVSSKPAAPVSLAVQQGSKAEEIVVEGDLYRITLSTEGAVVRNWVLKKYREDKEQPLDVVNRDACQKLGFPMSIDLADAALASKLNSALFVASPADHSLKVPAKVEFAFSDGKVQARKQFSFGPGYEVHAEVSVFDGQRFVPVSVAWPGGFGDHSLPANVRESKTWAVYGVPGNLTRVPAGKIDKERSVGGPLAALTFAGLEDLYFVGMFLPDAPDDVFRITRQEWTPAAGDEKQPQKLLAALLGSPQPKALTLRLFVAPKDLDILRAEKPPLDGLVDFGWFSVVAKPLFEILRYIYDHWIHNYGWAIVLLTIFINLALFPLRLKSIRSAQEMQKIAPLVKDIQERYKKYKFNDPQKQRMNQEIMKLYQEHGINPLSGCLPMLLQLPFLYAFYNVLSLSIELRHAPWILWVRDLSGPDTVHVFDFSLHVLPLVMIVTTFFMQKMTPMATADPAQQRMMTLMPLFFGFMFYSLASGLVLYWLTGNVVGIAQQLFINRTMPAAQSPPPGSATLGRSKPAARKAVGVNE